MRFVPHRNPELQESTIPLHDDFYSDTDTDTESDMEIRTENELNDDNINLKSFDSSSSLSLSSLEEIDKLPFFLSSQGLEHRFNLACKLADNNELFHFNNKNDSDLLNGKNNSDNLDNDNNFNRPNEHFNTNNYDSAANYFISRFKDERTKRYDTVNNLLKIEEERIRKEEEERRKKLEEEKRKKEEAQRKIREEAERKAKEEAERKRLEEEKRLKQIEEEKKRKEEEEKKHLENLKKKQEELKAEKEREIQLAKEEASKMIVKPKQIESAYLKYVQDRKNIDEQIVEPMKQDKELKKLVSSHKRKINPKFGQLTNSQEQLTRITNEIKTLVLQTKDNTQAYKWILNFVSDAIISQSETEVSVKPKSSIPLAKLTLNLMIIFKELEYFLLSKFYTSCPFLIGYSCLHETEEGRLRLGWKRDEDSGKWENEIQHNERLCGITTLYSVITRLKLDQTYLDYDVSSTKHPLPISNSWIFISRMVDIPTNQLTETHYAIVGAWWDACSLEFLQAYGRQSQKLLRLVADQWSSIGDKSSAGKVRLKLLGEEWTQGAISSFPNMEI